MRQNKKAKPFQKIEHIYDFEIVNLSKNEKLWIKENARILKNYK